MNKWIWPKTKVRWRIQVSSFFLTKSIHYCLLILIILLTLVIAPLSSNRDAFSPLGDPQGCIIQKWIVIAVSGVFTIACLFTIVTHEIWNWWRGHSCVDVSRRSAVGRDVCMRGFLCWLLTAGCPWGERRKVQSRRFPLHNCQGFTLIFSLHIAGIHIDTLNASQVRV